MPRYDDLAAFAAVVRAGSFTRAAAQMGITQSALSQTLRALEGRLDVKLLNRTTRSLSPTEAGERLYRIVGSRFADIDIELALLGELRGRPAGTVRITATEHAVRSLVWPKLLPWLPKYPDIRIEISSDNRFADIVADRFDIGVRLGGDVAKDMIAVRIAADLRMTIVASPAYFAMHRKPRQPQDLADHDCLCLRLPTHGGLMPWEFRQKDRNVNVHATGRLVFNRNDPMLEAALTGHGLAWLPHDLVREHVRAGRLRSALEGFAISYPGYHAYYASRRSSPALMHVIDALRFAKTTSKPARVR